MISNITTSANLNTLTHSKNNKTSHHDFAKILDAAKTDKTVATKPTPISEQLHSDSSKYMMLTDKGQVEINLDTYFKAPESEAFLTIEQLPPLLMPSADNIQTLSEHVSARFKQMLSDYNIPITPEKITFDDGGNMNISPDYAHMEALNKAFDENPDIKRELSTLNALSGHYAAIQERMPFIEGMQKANSQAAIDALIIKYSHLLHDNHDYKSLAFVFSKEGDVSVTADSKPLTFST